MTASTGRVAEARLYLVYCAALLRPGSRVPVFEQPPSLSLALSALTSDEHTLIIEEGRRQLDRQMADLERIRNRAGALATVSLALVAAVVTKTAGILKQPWPVITLWVIACALAALAVAGAASVMSARAVFGRTDTDMAAQGARPVRRYLAEAYAENVAIGEETVKTFLTVFRDAVALTITSAILFLIVLVNLAYGTSKSDHKTTEGAACPISTTYSATLTAQKASSLPLRVRSPGHPSREAP